MSDMGKVHVGKVLPPRTVGPLDGFAALSQIVNAVQDCINVHAEENTKQAKIAAYESIEVSRIKAAESILKQYFDQSFAERRTTFDEMFARLDAALDQGNPAVINSVLTGIIEVARTSPLAAGGDLGQIRAALDDPDHVWDL